MGCAGTTTRRPRRSTIVSRSSIRLAPILAPVAGLDAWPLRVTNGERPAMVPVIPKRISTAGSRRGSAPSTDLLTRPSSAAAGVSSTRRRSIPAGAVAFRRTGSRPRRRSTPASAAFSRRSSWSRACPRTSSGPRSSSPTTRTARVSCTGRSTLTSVRTRTNGTSPWTASSGATSS